MPELGVLGTKTVGYTKEGRAIVQNPDGSVSTERTSTVEVEGMHLNIPTMFQGKEVTVDEAMNRIRANGFRDPDTQLPIPAFKTRKDAEAAAVTRSKALGKEIQALGLGR